MSQIEWAMWANEQAITTSCVLFLGGVVGIAGMFKYWQFGIYGVFISLVIAILEWPRSKRKKGNTTERRYQRPFTVIVNKFGVAGKNYFVRFVFYLILCVPCCFTLSTLLGGICMLLTGFIYFAAAIKGEEWIPAGLEVKDEQGNKKRITSLHPPKKPPPRPATAEEQDISIIGTDSVTMEIVEERPTQGAESTRAMVRPTRPTPRPSAAASHVIQDSNS
ncbi:cytochrome b-245 light chain-like [Mya arenaria]|uniref:cytochrome b-245 light chain-like n=1 Tax=Mya arenaria TaxID=6604 RepID=UPI0022E8A1A8|nr:cytochrome b-245 light chain-like [Mya arenaria]XP_052818889.1 cytochrome b-245 light chain-like [Mya arenaria]